MTVPRPLETPQEKRRARRMNADWAAARALGRHAGRIPRTIRFAAWGAEEVGLVGSRAYVADHADQMKHIRFYLNLDSAGAEVPNILDFWRRPL